MRFFTDRHQYYCGIDLHARSMYLCILDHDRASHTPQEHARPTRSRSSTPSNPFAMTSSSASSASSPGTGSPISVPNRKSPSSSDMHYT